MLIVNKKYSNLLKGYRRSLELDRKLDTEWESSHKPALLKKLQTIESIQMKEYQQNLQILQENEHVEIEKWEKEEIERVAAWDAQCSQALRQNQIEINRHKRIGNILLIVCACSLVLVVFLTLLLHFISKTNFFLRMFLGIPRFFASLIFVGTSIGSLPMFLFKPDPFQKTRPCFPPRPVQKVPNLPIKAEEVIKKYSCPSVVTGWIEEIQYKDDGREYFRKFRQENPEANNGIPGEIAMLNSSRSIGTDMNSSIYILGLKTNDQGDIDGILISYKGVWILESKYLAGLVTYKNGVWKQSTFIKPYGHEYLDGWEEKEFATSFQPDDQLKKSIEKIRKILSRYTKKNPWLLDAIHGYLDFTHPEVTLDISDCDVEYSQNLYLYERFLRKQDIVELTLEKQLEIADLLLSENRKFEKTEISAEDLAEKIYTQYSEYLEKLVKNFKLS